MKDSITNSDLNIFLAEIDFNLPKEFLDHLKGKNYSEAKNVILWPLKDMIKLNKAYKVKEYAPEFFVFGSDGGDMAYAFEKTTGYVFEIPFIGMSKDEAVLISTTFSGFMTKT